MNPDHPSYIENAPKFTVNWDVGEHQMDDDDDELEMRMIFVILILEFDVD